MAANWTDFITSPTKASKRLHSSKRDVAFGQAVDEQRIREALRRNAQTETSAPHSPALSKQELAALRLYEQRRRAEPPRAEGALNIIRQQLPQFFRDNQQLADATGDLSLKEGVLGTAGAVLGGAMPIALGSGLTGVATGAGMSIAGDALMDESARKILGSSIQDPLSSGVFGALAGGTGKIIKPLIAAMGASSGDAEASALSAANKFQKMLAHLGKEKTTLLPAALDDVADEAVHLYIANPALFRGDAGTQSRAAQYMLHKGQMTPEQISRMPAIKKTLLDVLDQQLPLDTPLYRGTVRPANERPAYYGDVVGGDRGPASFSWSPSQAVDFMYGAGPEDKAVMLRALGSQGVRGITVPYEAEFETLLHPANRFRGHGVTPIEGEGSVIDMIPAPELFGKGFDYGAWRNGGQVKKAGGGAIKRLSRRAMSAFDDLRPSTVAPQGALSVVKNKGGNWLSGSVEDALRGLKKDEPNADAIWAALPRELIDKYWHASGPHQLVQANNPKEWAAAKQSLESPLNTWIDKQLTRYVKNDMATPEDPIRALAERGVLHFEPRGIRDRAPIMDQVVARRLMSGNPATERAVTPLGEQWERYADSAIMPQEVQELGAGAVGKNPWLAKLRPSDTVYKTDTWRIGDNAEENLGFDHLVDELSNALNPASGLPQHLQFPAERLGKVSVPQAVERVAQINAWRAAQQAEADALRANNAATVLHKEYPEKGMRWVELKQGTSKLPEDFDTWSPAEQANYKALPDKEARADLQDALKYEGDTMGHCVGGYCDDVLSGHTKIYSLRDAKGQPHVTVEVAPQRGYGDDDAMRDQLFTPELQEEWLRGVESGEIPGTITQAEWARQKFGVAEPLSRIIQIKGKQNKAPNPEYLPFVQDFVRSGQWSDVGDLQNTGLRRTIDAFNSNELKKIQEAGIEVPQWATQDDIDRISKAVWPGMAAGGAVKQNPLRDNFQGIIAAIEQELRNAA